MVRVNKVLLLLLLLYRQLGAKACARTHARNYNFECDWLIELSNNKLSDNNLVSELVENRSFLKCHNDQKIISYFPSDFESLFA